MQQLSTMQITISADQAKTIAQAIREGMWEWHIYLGYALAFLVLYRIVLFFVDSSKKESFNSLTLHKKMVKLSYYLFYALIFFMSVSGLVLEFHESLSLAKDTAHDIKEVHEFVYNFFLFFVPAHIIGVVIADNGDEQGLTSTMINGKA